MRLPEQFASMIPYVVTIIGLCFMNVHFRMRRIKKETV